MTDMRTPAGDVLPATLHTMDRYSALMSGRPVLGVSFTIGVVTWVSNHAVYVPMMIPFAFPVKRVFWVNGSTITTTNADFGIFDGHDGTKIYSVGSGQAMSGASSVQYVTPGTEFIIGPGIFYFGWSCNGTTSRGYGTTTLTATLMRHCGILQQGTAFPLPATATFATASQALVPLCGVSRFASGF